MDSTMVQGQDEANTASKPMRHVSQHLVRQKSFTPQNLLYKPQKTLTQRALYTEGFHTRGDLNEKNYSKRLLRQNANTPVLTPNCF